ncbi:DUF3325 family protein [Pseudoduganella umbonata]|nr:DUF3325 family protein [Pseudoduganella umbonata]MBB3225132.1 hypothetical protein [Pseudoduganella umbonata]
MAELLSTVAALAMCGVACALLALSQREHWAAAANLLPYPALQTVCRIRVVASVLLAAAPVSCVAAHGAGFGLLLWMLLLATGGLATAFVLAWRPRWLASLAFFMCDIV